MGRAHIRKTWHGDRILAAVRVGEVRGLRLAAEHLLGESRRIGPIDESTLTRSGETSIDASGRKAAVSYNTPYAVRQHEEMDYRHTPGRQAKYLEQPFHAERKALLAIIAAEVRKTLRG